MDSTIAKTIADKIIGQVFGYQNPLSLDQILAKFAFDVRLPQQVYDSETNQPTWAQSINPSKFVTYQSTVEKPDGFYERPKRPINSIQDILGYWSETNAMSTERMLESINVSESDNIRQSENVYRSQDIGNSKNVLFSDGANDCEFIIGCQRSNSTNFSIRVEDSTQCSNSFSVSWSAKIASSFFIQDCNNMQNCMFCSHLNSKQFWIANMPFEEAEYRKILDMVVRWTLTS